MESDRSIDTNSSSTPRRQAWRQTRAHSRRIRFWVKNSITSIAHNHVEFLQEESLETVEPNDEQDNTSDDDDVCMEEGSCQNIDDAMAALHTLKGEESMLQTWKDAPELQPDYDWILDGDPEWAAEYDKSRQLQQSLQGLELEDPMLSMDVNVLGRQEFCFANFDDDMPQKEDNDEPQKEDNDDEFGDFVSANVPDAMESVPTVPTEESTTATEDDNFEKDCNDNDDPETPTKTSTESNEATVVEQPHSVYNLFPLADVSSPESRFTRRRQLMTRQFADSKNINGEKEWWCKSDQEMEEDLPSEYYTEAFDGTLELLLELPWEHVSCWQDEKENIVDTNDIMIVDEHVTQKLSQLDAAQAHVKTKLIRQIQQREDLLDEGNQLLHDMDHNLAMAHLYVNRGKDALNKAQGQEEDFSGIVGVGTLIHDSDRRDDLRQLKSVLDQCNKLLDTEESLEQRIASFGTGPMMQDASMACEEYRQVIEIATQLRKDVDHDKGLSRLVCLDQLRERACCVVETFRNRIDAALTLFLGRCCHVSNAFSSLQYETLLRAMFDVHSHQAKERNSVNSNHDEASCNDASPPNLGHSWSQCILKSLCYEADKCLARALLDPTLDEDEEFAESSFDKELIHLGFELNNGSGDNAKLRTLMHNLVTIRFDFESDRNHLPWVYHKLCMLLADVLHTHYLLVQWHRTPFDQRNKDMTYLHRKEEIEKPEEKKTDEFHTSAEPIAATPTLNGGSANDSNQVNTDESSCNSASNPQHYGIEKTEHLDRILSELHRSRVPLWRHCESVLVTCLDQYIHFSGKQNLFQGTKGNSSDGEKAWADDLERLHDVLRLTQQFLTLGREFLGPDSAVEVTSLRNGGQESELREKLRDVFRKHLRLVHVEAMNSTGTMLFHETWKLVPVETTVANHGSSSGRIESRVSESTSSDKKQAAKKCVLDLLEAYTPVVNSKQRCWENRMNKNGSFYVEHLPNYPERGNPFVATPMVETESETVRGSARRAMEQAEEQAPSISEPVKDEAMELYSIIHSFLGDNDRCFPPLGTDSAVNGLAKWTWRLITIMKRLPIILEETAIVFSNIFDLYFTTVFRLCAGSGMDEKIILGMQVQTPQEPIPAENGYSSPDPNTPGLKRHSSGSGIFGRQRRRSVKAPSRPIPIVPLATEAEICAPLPCETERISLLRDFLQNGKANLDGIVNLDKIEKWMTEPVVSSTTSLDKDVVSNITSILEKREGAAWSCIFVAALVDAAWSCADKMFVRSCFLDTIFGEHERVSSVEKEDYPSKALAPLAAYAKSVVNVVPTLAELASRVSCSRAVLPKSIVQDIISVRQWGESNVHVESNDYIYDLTDRYTTTWLFLESSPHPLPCQVLDKTWEHLQSAAYLSILDGFARVCRFLPNFPAEGIALMSMDIAAFASGLAEIGSRNDTTTARLLVSQWITALYLPDVDLMQWITSNYLNYQLNHSLALVTSRAGSEGKINDANDMLSQVMTLYSIKGVEDPPPQVQRHNSC